MNLSPPAGARQPKAAPSWDRKLWAHYLGATHEGAILSGWIVADTIGMTVESKSGKDNLKVEKLSLLVLTLCILVLVYLLVAHPF